jgi:hypothetical protein
MTILYYTKFSSCLRKFRSFPGLTKLSTSFENNLFNQVMHGAQKASKNKKFSFLPRELSIEAQFSLLMVFN